MPNDLERTLDLNASWKRQLESMEEVDGAAGRCWRGLLEEANAIAEAIAHNWDDQPRGDGTVSPGLASALTAGAADEISAIAGALSDAVNAYSVAVDAHEGELVPCAEFVFSEVTAALDFLAGPGPAEPALARLLAARAEEPENSDALATRLIDCARLAAPHRAALERLRGFDVGLLDEAIVLADELHLVGRRCARTTEARRALAHRDRVATLLQHKLTHVRHVAWFVFRRRPEVLRQFPSPYEYRMPVRRTRAREEVSVARVAGRIR